MRLWVPTSEDFRRSAQEVGGSRASQTAWLQTAMARGNRCRGISGGARFFSPTVSARGARRGDRATRVHRQAASLGRQPVGVWRADGHADCVRIGRPEPSRGWWRAHGNGPACVGRTGRMSLVAVGGAWKRVALGRQDAALVRSHGAKSWAGCRGSPPGLRERGWSVATKCSGRLRLRRRPDCLCWAVPGGKAPPRLRGLKLKSFGRCWPRTFPPSMVNRPEGRILRKSPPL